MTMKLAQHTPGPWLYEKENGEIFLDDRDGDDVMPLIATVNFSNTDPPQAHADGMLIAASPELLAALKVLLAWNDEDRGTRFLEDGLAAARAAVAKAEG